MTDDGMPSETAIVKGGKLIEASARDSAVVQSVWTDVIYLESYGWYLEYNAPGEPDKQETSKLQMYADMGLPAEQDDNTKMVVKHMHESQPQGEGTKVYPRTKGFYTCTYSPRAIVAHKSESPAWQGLPPDEVVPWKFWSDVVFLQWQDYCESDQAAMRNLRYIFRTDITNDTTIRIVNTALQEAGQTIRQWEDSPATFAIESRTGRAILATPNGVGAVWLLAQHKRQLGDSRIAAVTVFWLKGWNVKLAPLNLCFHVRPVE